MLCNDCSQTCQQCSAGVLTETTAELALSLTFAAARRIVEADRFMRGAYARMMVEGHKCNLVYYDPYPNKFLDKYISDYNQVLKNADEEPISLRKLDSVEEVLKESDVSLHAHILPVILTLAPLLSCLL